MWGDSLKKKLFIVALLIFILTSNSHKLYAEKIKDDEIYSSSAVAIDSETGAILFSKDKDKKVYPASTTKIITAILAIENLDLETPVTASREALYSVPLGSSSIYLKVGETMSVKNLLYGLLIQSGNDAGNVLAEAVAPDIDTFVEMMNEKAKQIGCTNTHFTNTHGFHDDNHYTTASDMAKMMQYCLQNEEFKKIISTKTYTINETNKTLQKRVMTSTNKMFNKKYEDMYYEYIIGGKTGFTDEAQGTFVGYLKKDDKSIIVSVFDGPQDIDGNEARFIDTKKLSEYIFDDFTENEVLTNDDLNIKIIDKNTKKQYSLGIKNSIKTLSDNENYRIFYDIDVLNSINYDDISSKVGNFSITAKNNDSSFLLTNSYDLYITNSEEYKYFNIHDYLPKIIIFLLIILILLIIIEMMNKSKMNKKEKFKRRKFKDKDLNRINR